MMNELIKQLALNAGLLNYVDHETPRRYFVHGHAEQEEVAEFAELIVRECAHLVGGYTKENEFGTDVKEAYEEITKHFGVES